MHDLAYVTYILLSETIDNAPAYVHMRRGGRRKGLKNTAHCALHKCNAYIHMHTHAYNCGNISIHIRP